MSSSDGSIVKFKYKNRSKLLNQPESQCREISLELFQGDHIEKQVKMLKTFYEDDLLTYLAHILAPGGLYIDVGANVGNHAVFFGCFMADFVVCVEPLRSHQRLLEGNLRRHGIAFKIERCAIGEYSGEAYMAYPEGKADSPSMCYLVADLSPGMENRIVEKVSVKTLDQIVDENSELCVKKGLSLIKIDVEKLEAAVLLGGKESIKKYLPHLIIECATEESKKNVDEILRPIGYSSIAKFCATPTYHYVHHSHSPLIALGLRFYMRHYLTKILHGVIKLSNKFNFPR